MRRIYVAHPYGALEENKQSVEAIIKQLIETKPKDYVFISPIHTFGFMYENVDYIQGMNWCLSLLETCDELWLCKGWENSRGCNMEYTWADGERPIRFVGVDV